MEEVKEDIVIEVKDIPICKQGKVGKDGIVRYGHSARQWVDREMTDKINNGHVYMTSDKREKLVQNLVMNPEMSIQEAAMKAGYSKTSPVPYKRETQDYIKAVLETKAAEINADWLKDKFQLLSTLAVDDKDFSSAIRCIENLCRMLGAYKDSMDMKQTLIVKSEDRAEAEELIGKMYGDVPAISTEKKEVIEYDKDKVCDRSSEERFLEYNEVRQEQREHTISDAGVQEVVS